MKEEAFKFEELKVYQKSLKFIDEVYSISEQFPENENYGLRSQFRRAACSIALNIAEGAGDTDAQFHRFLQIATNSVQECLVCSTIANRRGYLDDENNQSLREKLIELSKMIHTLKKYLKK
ncbi:four helix bundle protein [Croceiramulus getboli]|nr:four helix bundle protein [Flavobacteriaceae bacterium YJPT1-3]